jgi:hypothetical protein
VTHRGVGNHSLAGLRRLAGKHAGRARSDLQYRSETAMREMLSNLNLEFGSQQWTIDVALGKARALRHRSPDRDRSLP